MSKSYRHTAIHGHCGGSEKQDKRQYNRCLRKRVRHILRAACDNGDYAVTLPEVREVSNLWTMQKDGKTFWRALDDFVRSMNRSVRVRGGRVRYQYVMTDCSVELAMRTYHRYRLRLSGCSGSELSVEDAKIFAARHFDLLRK